jgi:PAS domain S-box-containing protein
MKKILVIEDDAMILKNIASFLTEEGFEVITADDGIQGIQVALEFIPDLIISDISMPKKDGYEVCKTLQSVPATSTIPFIFLTAKSQKDDLRLGMLSGADDYLTKPFDYSELLMSVKIRLEKHDRLLKQSDEKFYAMIDNPLMGVFIYSENKFEYVNNTFSKMLGLNINDFKNMSFEDIVATEPSDPVIDKIKRTLKGIQENVQIEFEAYCQDKQKKLFVELYATSINFKGVASLVGNIVDITEKENRKNPFKVVENTDNLSKREIQILKQVCLGQTTTEIATANNIAPRTVDTHRAHLLDKTGSRNSAELILYALRKRIIIVD